MEGVTCEFKLHLIGKLNEVDYERASKDSRIILHGHLDELSIERISTRSWVGLSSFALFRKNMKSACTLKVREYLRMGLPVYSSYQEVFPDSVPYYRMGNPSILNILEFANEMRGIERDEIIKNTNDYIDKKVLLDDFNKYVMKFI